MENLTINMKIPSSEDAMESTVTNKLKNVSVADENEFPEAVGSTGRMALRMILSANGFRMEKDLKRGYGIWIR